MNAVFSNCREKLADLSDSGSEMMRFDEVFISPHGAQWLEFGGVMERLCGIRRRMMGGRGRD